MTLAELRQRRGELVTQQRQLLDANPEGLSGEQTEQYDRIESDLRDLEGQIGRVEQLTERERTLAAAPAPRHLEQPGAERHGRESGEYRQAFESYLRGQNFDHRALDEYTAPGTAGGYLVPEQWQARIIEALPQENIMRQLCRVSSTSTVTNVPVVTSEGAAAWTAEAGAYGETDDVFGTFQIDAHKATRIIKVSEELLADNTYNLESHLARSFARSFGRLEETAFVVGTGSGQPTGFTGSATVGVTTAAADAITSDELLTHYHKLRGVYRDRAVWLMHDNTALVIRKLKNAVSGDYMWQPGLQAGQPDRLLGRPVFTSAAMPEIAATKKVIAFGDFSYYGIWDRGARSFMRLNELYAANGQVGFLAMERVDGKLELAEAIQMLVMHA